MRSIPGSMFPGPIASKQNLLLYIIYHRYLAGYRRFTSFHLDSRRILQDQTTVVSNTALHRRKQGYLYQAVSGFGLLGW